MRLPHYHLELAENRSLQRQSSKGGGHLSRIYGIPRLCLAKILSVCDFHRIQSCCPQAECDSKLA